MLMVHEYRIEQEVTHDISHWGIVELYGFRIRQLKAVGSQIATEAMIS